MILLENDMVICKICNKLLNDPRVLPCGESVCSGCIPTDCKIFSCNFCLNSHQVPLEGFVVNRALVKSLEAAIDSKSIEKSLQSFNQKMQETDSNLQNILNFSPETNISELCSNLINQIDLEFETKLKTITELRESLIKQVRDHEKHCLENFAKNQDKHQAQLERIKQVCEETKCCLREAIVSDKEIFKLDLLKSKFKEYETEIMRDTIDYTHLWYSLSKWKIEQDFIGKINSRNLKKLKPDHFTKETISFVCTSNPKILRLENGITVVCYWKIVNSNENRHDQVYIHKTTKKAQLILSLFKNNVKNSIIVDSIFSIPKNFLIKVYEEHIFVLLDKIFQYDYNLKMIKQFKFPKQVDDFVVRSNTIIVLSQNYLEYYGLDDFRFFITQTLFSYSELCFKQIFANKYLILKNEKNLIITLGNIVQTINFENDSHEILKVTDDGKIWVHDRKESKILALFFDGELCKQIDLEGFSSNIQIQLHENERFELIDYNSSQINIFSLLND
ncbi:hypothetical protein BpHYR1_044313 [Brachionus plicatilis]|uniref:RING-type domain-containing protein n=1 Tax=Brachionus plicatilis TaxID=10195 RepID=A0A3M7T626_BRAPC|nr:hypothetical protein BpHYR1_044313 [Brachionus plicatilis]